MLCCSSMSFLLALHKANLHTYLCMPSGVSRHPACGRSFLAGDCAHVCRRCPIEVFLLFHGMCTRVVTFYVLRARRACRLRDISTEIDAHGITVTQLPFLSTVGWLRAQILVFIDRGRHFEVRWGCERTRFSNVSAGVSILVNKGSWKPRHVVRTFDALSEAARKSKEPFGSETGRKTSLRLWSTGLHSRQTRAAQQPTRERCIPSLRMTCKDAPEHAREKHALHHDGPQRSDGRPQG